MDDVRYLRTIEEIRGISDPYRHKILNCFYKLSKPVTVKQIADELGEVPAKIHYHVKKMEKVGILVLVHTKEINGIIAKYYEPTAKKFNIETKGTDSEDRLVRLSETQKVISQLYDESKEVFLSHSSREGPKRSLDKGMLSMENLYLSAEEAEELKNYINAYLDKHCIQKKEPLNGEREYHCFFSMIVVDGNNKKE